VDKLTISHYASLTNSGKMSQTTFFYFKGMFTWQKQNLPS